MSIPISKDSLSLNDFLDVNNIYASPNQDYYYLRDTLNLFKLNQQDFLPDLEFSFSDSISFPLFFAIPPNQIAPISIPSNHQFNFQDLQLHEILFNRLVFNYTASSNIDGNFFLIIHLPNALHENGDLFYDTVEIRNANGNNNPLVHQIEIENLRLDLSNNGSTYNSISTRFQIKSGNDTIPPNFFSNVNLGIELSELDIAYMKGYFGNTTINSEFSTNINILKKLSSNMVQLHQPELEIMIKNGVGMDAQIAINEIEFTRNQVSKFLSHYSLGQYINISRAQDLGWDFNYSNKSIYINEQNSNINEIINLIPTQIISSYQLETNPQGNHAGFNDFYYTNKPLTIDAVVTLPLLFNADSLVYSDTFSIELPDILRINEANLDLVIENGLPMDVCFDLRLLNGKQISMIQPCLFHSNLDSNNLLDSPSYNRLLATLDSTDYSILLNEKKIVLNTTIHSPDTTSFFPVILSDWLNYKLGITLNADINIE